MAKICVFRWVKEITVFVGSYIPLSEDGAGAVERVLVPYRTWIVTSEFFSVLPTPTVAFRRIGSEGMVLHRRGLKPLTFDSISSVTFF
ncbi:MAG: hypothetical protein OSA11_06000 [Candidatus Nanopelagicales bacterium]|nr:hypothetical protein [Candidatus Nanopelagicales bacterium]